MQVINGAAVASALLLFLHWCTGCWVIAEQSYYCKYIYLTLIFLTGLSKQVSEKTNIFSSQTTNFLLFDYPAVLPPIFVTGTVKNYSS